MSEEEATEGPGQLGLADSGGPAKQEHGDGPRRVIHPGFESGSQVRGRAAGPRLTDDLALERFARPVEVEQQLVAQKELGETSLADEERNGIVVAEPPSGVDLCGVRWKGAAVAAGNVTGELRNEAHDLARKGLIGIKPAKEVIHVFQHPAIEIETAVLLPLNRHPLKDAQRAGVVEDRHDHDLKQVGQSGEEPATGIELGG